MWLRISILNLRIGDTLLTPKTSRPSVGPDAVHRIYRGGVGDCPEGSHLLWLLKTPDGYRLVLTCLWVVREPPEGLPGDLKISLDCSQI